MSQIRMTGITLLAGLAAVLLLGRIAMLEPQLQERRKSAAVTAPHRQHTLSDDNLADAFAGLVLKERLTRVGWDHSILTVDLTIREGREEAAALWSDMTELVRFSFGEVRNIRQMLVRVYLYTGDRRALLFYGDSRRENWTAEQLASLRVPEPGADGVFRLRLGLERTPAGERWLRNLAIS